MGRVVDDLEELTRLIPAMPKLTFRMRMIPRYGAKQYAVAENFGGNVIYYATVDSEDKSQIHGLWMLTSRSHIIVRADSYGDCRELLIDQAKVKLASLSNAAKLI